MLVVRAIKADDLDALYVMASQVGSGMTTLKPDMKMLGDRLAIAVASFAETIPPEKRDYMFVMEDTDTGKLAGVCAIRARSGWRSRSITTVSARWCIRAASSMSSRAWK